MVPLIPRSVVCCFDGCKSEGVYATAYKIANEKAEKSSCVEQIATAVALGVLSSSCISLSTCVVGQSIPFSWPELSVDLSVGCLACTLPLIDLDTGVIYEYGILSSGCVRDYKVLQETFVNSQSGSEGLSIVLLDSDQS